MKLIFVNILQGMEGGGGGGGGGTPGGGGGGRGGGGGGVGVDGTPARRFGYAAVFRNDFTFSGKPLIF